MLCVPQEADAENYRLKFLKSQLSKILKSQLVQRIIVPQEAYTGKVERKGRKATTDMGWLRLVGSLKL